MIYQYYYKAFCIQAQTTTGLQWAMATVYYVCSVSHSVTQTGQDTTRSTGISSKPIETPTMTFQIDQIKRAHVTHRRHQQRLGTSIVVDSLGTSNSSGSIIFEQNHVYYGQPLWV